MPRPPRFRIARIDDLFRQIAFASDDARRRQIHASEILLDEVRPGQTYRGDVVAHRITGFRPERSASRLGEVEPRGEELLVGEALIADLTAFVLRLSEHLVLRPEERPGGAEPVDALAARLGVTQRTLQRWRQLGLPMHWIEFDGQRKLGCYGAAVESFLRRRPEARRRRPNRRLGSEERARLVEEARARRAAVGGSLSSVAAEVAQAHGRAHETVRLLLERHDARAAQPIFTGTAADRTPLDDRDRRFVERAWRRGVPLARIAEHLHRSVPAVHRQLMVRRRERLTGLRLRWVELPTFSLPEAEEVILSASAVRQGLRLLAGEVDVLAILRSIRAAARLSQRPGRIEGPPEGPRPRIRGREPSPARARGRAMDAMDAGQEEDARVDALVAAWNLLKRRAARGIGDLPPVPPARAIDAVQRDLRWAALVQQTLMEWALREAVRRADLWAGRRIEELAADALREVMLLLVQVAAEVIDRVDPSRGNRLDRLVALEVEKALASRGPDRGATGRDGAVRARAAAGHAPGSIAVPGLFDDLSPWQSWLGPPPAWRAALGALPEIQARAATLAHGLDGTAPRTMREVARALGASPSVAARWVLDGEAGLRRGSVRN